MRTHRVECRLPNKYYHAFSNVADDKGMSIGKVVKLVLMAKYHDIKPIRLSVDARAVILSRLSKILGAVSKLYNPINSESDNLNQTMKYIHQLKKLGQPLSSDEAVVSMYEELTPGKSRKPLLKLDRDVTELWRVFEQSTVNYHK